MNPRHVPRSMVRRVHAQLDRQLLGDLYIEGKENHAQAARNRTDQRVCIWRPGRSIRWLSISESTGTAHLAATGTSPSQVEAGDGPARGGQAVAVLASTTVERPESPHGSIAPVVDGGTSTERRTRSIRAGDVPS